MTIINSMVKIVNRYYFHKAAKFVISGDYNEAEQVYIKIIKKDPANRKALKEYAKVAMLKCDWPTAIECWERIIKAAEATGKKYPKGAKMKIKQAMLELSREQNKPCSLGKTKNQIIDKGSEVASIILSRNNFKQHGYEDSGKTNINLQHLKPEMLNGNMTVIERSSLIWLEAWRRSLAVQLKRKSWSYRIESKERSVDFVHSYALNYRADSILAKKYCKNKDITKLILFANGVTVPAGIRFYPSDSNDSIIMKSKGLNWPVVVKPTSESLARGVFVNITDENILRNTLVNVRENLGHQDIIVEEHIDGEEFRLYVLGGNVIGAIKRTVPSVDGNGIDTIEQLINKKNLDRKRNLFLGKYPIKVDNEIKNTIAKHGYQLSSIPPNKEKVLIREKPSSIMGGETIEVSEALHDIVKKHAIAAVAAIPGLDFGGLDMIIKDSNCACDAGVILEINHMPQYDAGVFPYYGEPNDIPSKLMDYYFPESIANRNINRRFYYNFKQARMFFIEDYAINVHVKPAPLNSRCEKILLYGKVQNVGFRKWVQKRARKLNISGFVKNKKKFVCIVAHGNQSNLKKFKNEILNGPKNAQVDEVEVCEWNGEVVNGFEIRETS